MHASPPDKLKICACGPVQAVALLGGLQLRRLQCNAVAGNAGVSACRGDPGTRDPGNTRGLIVMSG